MLSVTRPIALATALASAALLAGCGGSDDAAGNGRSAVAAFYPLAWVTDRVAGDEWEVDNLTQPGQEPHDLELTIAQTAALEEADLIVLNHGFQNAISFQPNSLAVIPGSAFAFSIAFCRQRSSRSLNDSRL